MQSLKLSESPSRLNISRVFLTQVGKGGASVRGRNLSKTHTAFSNMLGLRARLSRYFPSVSQAPFSRSHVGFCGGGNLTHDTAAFRNLGEEVGSCMEVSFYESLNN